MWWVDMLLEMNALVGIHLLNLMRRSLSFRYSVIMLWLSPIPISGTIYLKIAFIVKILFLVLRCLRIWSWFSVFSRLGLVWKVFGLQCLDLKTYIKTAYIIFSECSEAMKTKVVRMFLCDDRILLLLLLFVIRYIKLCKQWLRLIIQLSTLSF